MLEVKWRLPSMDDWQKEIIELERAMVLNWNDKDKLNQLTRNFMLFCGRQVGKSETVAFCLAELLLNVPKIKLLIISGVERQASSLYDKVLHYVEDNHRFALKSGKDRPLKTEMKFKNGSELITEPVGIDGASARRHTLHGIIFEEMQLLPEACWGSLTPMLVTTNGFMWMLGTAWATEGYVYDRLSDKDFKIIRVNSEEVFNKRPEPNRTQMLYFLEKERHRLSESVYAQEYLAIPQENARQVFPDTLIAKCLNVQRENTIDSNADYICGVDPAGLGEDEGDIVILKNLPDGDMKQIDNIITKKLLTTETTTRILELNRRYNFKKIFVDDGGVGFGVFSELKTADETRYITEALNNSSRSLDIMDEDVKKIAKYDYVINLLTMMERGNIGILDDPEIRESLKSYRFEYEKNTKKLLIQSNYNHPVEALMRAAWYYQSKGLNLSVYSIKI
jgi:hypothetical protein